MSSAKESEPTMESLRADLKTARKALLFHQHQAIEHKYTFDAYTAFNPTSYAPREGNSQLVLNTELYLAKFRTAECAVEKCKLTVAHQETLLSDHMKYGGKN